MLKGGVYRSGCLDKLQARHDYTNSFVLRENLPSLGLFLAEVLLMANTLSSEVHEGGILILILVLILLLILTLVLT